MFLLSTRSCLSAPRPPSPGHSHRAGHAPRSLSPLSPSILGWGHHAGHCQPHPAHPLQPGGLNSLALGHGPASSRPANPPAARTHGSTPRTFWWGLSSSDQSPQSPRRSRGVSGAVTSSDDAPLGPSSSSQLWKCRIWPPELGPLRRGLRCPSRPDAICNVYSGLCFHLSPFRILPEYFSV